MLDVQPTEKPFAEITTKEQAINWLDELTADMLLWRDKCRKQVTVDGARRALWTFLNKQGQVIGALKTLALVGLLDDRAYREYNQRAINTLIPDVQ